MLCCCCDMFDMWHKQKPLLLLLLQPAAAASVLHCCGRASYDVLVGSAVHGRTTAWISCYSTCATMRCGGK
jgi:hypothetical protein